MNSSDYVCDYCSRSFTRKYNLQTHIENCHLNSSCYCEICHLTFGSPSGLSLHLYRGHNRFSQPYPECDLCGRIFTRKQNIVSHMMTVHLQGLGAEIKCQFCQKVFTTERNLKRHINVLHNSTSISCGICHKVFRERKRLNEHMNTHYVKSVQCSLCDKAYTSNANLKRHVEMYHGEKEEFRCNMCPKIYTSNQSLRRHIRTRHQSESNDAYACDFCEFSAIGKDNLNAHMSNCHNDAHESENINVCQTCGCTFDTESVLRQHIKTEHPFDVFYKYCRESLLKDVGKRHKQVFLNCEYCDNNYNNIYELKHHLRTVHDKEYSLTTCNVCFGKFYTQETINAHRQTCIPPPNVNSCSHCDKLFTDISSLEFHIRIFHPQAQIADSNITSTKDDALEGNYKCDQCERVYYSDRSLKHHVKLRHSTGEAVECDICSKVFNNKYYLAFHKKNVHSHVAWSKCDYCDKQFKSKRYIRRHIKYTHLGMQRYKCIECETLFKEKKSLRKHVRSKHPNSTAFQQCHICHKRFESAKSCKIHLKLLHSFNMNTFPCDLCPVSFSSNEALAIHLKTKHLSEDKIFKCKNCNSVFKGQEKFDSHKEYCQYLPNTKVLPRCVLCAKDFSTKETLKRHVKNFHTEFDADDLANYGLENGVLTVDCENCVRNLQDEFHYEIYQRYKDNKDAFIFKCEMCKCSFNSLDYLVHRYKLHFESSQGKMILSELCTTQMSDDDEFGGFGSLHDHMEAESTTDNLDLDVVKSEPVSP
ncbi:zinc finger protein 845 [Amyelois transitella]|uniref:zinc finger protein 845 n=1 Tax=Amyelois transitella TaxID=680683 RepID=UPI0029904A00|nr:zinc finger protein 845 [Amyelois transitella]XP_013187861.2 zinc finger protein 845 [Amyelois transitella]XP_060808315.1 zinc finger protein 845 [Amyelois transitella]XP_060808316.1 zinc finger protein 845 [Amyelois transitella]